MLRIEDVIIKSKVKYKVIPVHAWTGREVSRRIMKRKFPVTPKRIELKIFHFLAQSINQIVSRRIMEKKISSETKGNRTQNLPFVLAQCTNQIFHRVPP